MASATELRELDFEELESRLSEAKRELFNLRFQVVTGQLDNVSRIRRVRRDVARIMTVLREQEIAAADAIQATTAGPRGGPEKTAGPRGRPERAAQLEAEAPDEEGS
jgi:large subunit ribosomal protein L29